MVVTANGNLMHYSQDYNISITSVIIQPHDSYHDESGIARPLLGFFLHFRKKAPSMLSGTDYLSAGRPSCCQANSVKSLKESRVTRHTMWHALTHKTPVTL